ncbi:MAG: peptidoglycan DD-metalloendopeptidase family protein [Xanthomonadaceae bacterium]|nr:peptidoglycan DD-metalloendopeptidase family protein [Xanthomonadaceae bacterium]
MPRSPAVPRRARALLLAALVCAGVAAAAAAPDPGNKAAQAAAQQRLDAVRATIAALVQQQQATLGERDQLDAALARQAQQLAAAAAAERDAAAALDARRQDQQRLEAQRALLQVKLQGRRSALASLLRAAYAQGRDSDLRLLLGDSDVARVQRALTYAQYLQSAQIARIHALLGDLRQLDVVQAALVQSQAALTAARVQARAAAAALAAQRARQLALRDQAGARYRDQAARLVALKRNEQDLETLLRRLRDVFADIPKSLPADRPFAELRGRLPWPARGAVSSGEGGLDIAAAAGSAVRAVAHGRVAYAQWLRGFGMLVIVDHGNGWMSLYGNNESLLVRVGDWVDAGQAVATAAAPGPGQAGVYFGLRHDSKAVDARAWLTDRR